MKLLTLYIVSTLAFGMSALAYDAPKSDVEIANDIVPQVIQQGWLRVDKPAAVAWIDQWLWAKFDAEYKAKFAASVAIYCSPHDPVIEIFDKDTAKKIARWGWSKGLEVF